MKEPVLDIKLTVRDWPGNQIQVMILLLGLISTSITVLDAYNEIVEDIYKARLVNDTMKSK